MVLRLTRGIYTIVTGRAGQSVIYTSRIQCRMVEARGKTASGLMAVLACV